MRRVRKRLRLMRRVAGKRRRIVHDQGSDEPAAKRLRAAGLTEEEQLELCLSDDQVGLLALGKGAVKKLKVAALQRWVAAALIAGGQEGSIEDKDSAIGSSVAVLARNFVTGTALVNLTLEKLMADGIARGPAEVLAERIARLRAPTVTWKGPAPLLHSTGFDWDFQDNGIVDRLREHVPEHYAQWKAGNRDKTVHPLFIVLGPPGTSKSRTLQEMPKLLTGMFDDPELDAKIRDAYVINLTFENGHSELVTPEPFDPSKELGVRLMRQLGVPRPDTQPTLVEALQALARAVKKHPKDMTIILAVDGIQGLPGRWTDTGSAFHRGMRVVADLVNGVAEAFVIGAVSCSTMVPGEVTNMLAATRQLRGIITPRPLVSIKRSVRPVFDNSLRLLVSDMGGLGAALAALEEAIKDWKPVGEQQENLSILFGSVRSKLVSQYPAYTGLSREVIGAALTGTWFDPTVDFKGCGKPADCCLCTLVTLEYNEDGRARFVVPYVLLALKGFLGYNFDDYRERKDPEDQFVTAMHWTSFEEAVALFWRMKSHVFANGPISFGELHWGADMRKSTKARQCNAKPLGIARSKRRIEELNRHAEFDNVVLNAAGASGPDVIQPLCADRRLFCAGQMKNFAQTKLTEKLFNEERAKASAKEHLFIALTTGKAESSLRVPPRNTAVVSKANYKDYFGPFAFRMFQRYVDLNRSSVNTLMLIEGVGREMAVAIVEHRGGGYRTRGDLARIVDKAGKHLRQTVRTRLESFLAHDEEQ